MAYRTKTQKRNALQSIKQKAKKLWLSGILSTDQLNKIMRAVETGMKKV